MSSPEPWTRRGAIYGAISVVVAIIAIVVAVITPEVRCLAHLDGPDKCRVGTPSKPRNGDITKAIVDAPIDPNLPYLVDSPVAHGLPNESPYIELDVGTIVNRGKPVPVTLSGKGFFANSHAQIEWFSPDGGTYIATGVDTDERGLFSHTLLWLPLRYAGIAGNNGAWKMRVTDLTSGGEDLIQLNVTSDNQTPTPDQWPTRETWNVQSYGPATVSAGTSGSLCSVSGAQSSLYVKGFTPEANLSVDYFRPDGQRIVHSTKSADGIGGIDNSILYWKTWNCATKSDFTYRVVVTESATGRQAESSLIFTTHS